MTRKRIALSVPPEMDDVLDRISVLTQQPKTKIILELLEEFVPVLQQTLDALEQIQENKENAVNIAKQFAHEMLLDGNQKLGQWLSRLKTLNNEKALRIAVLKALESCSCTATVRSNSIVR